MQIINYITYIISMYLRQTYLTIIKYFIILLKVTPTLLLLVIIIRDITILLSLSSLFFIQPLVFVPLSFSLDIVRHDITKRKVSIRIHSNHLHYYNSTISINITLSKILSKE